MSNRSKSALLALVAITLPLAATAQRAAEYEVLPRYREGGTPFDANQSLHPRAIYFNTDKDAPNPTNIVTPREYDPMDGVLYSYVPGQWNDVVRDLVVGLTADPACPTCDEIAYVAVPSQSVQNSAASYFAAGGADMSKVVFVQAPMNALWMRDYGPHFIWDNGSLALADSHYYPSRPADNFVPTFVGDTFWDIPTYDQGLYYSGGNFMPGPNRSGFVTALISLDNPASEGFSTAVFEQNYSDYMGIDTLHIMPQLPFSVDGTGHIDMWMYIVDDDDVIISEFVPGSNSTAINVTNNAVPYMQGLGFTVHRTPAWNVGFTHFTYTNAFRVNDRIFSIKYENGYQSRDAQALATFQNAAGPGVGIYPINCWDIIPAAGAIHCIVMQVPRRVDADPGVQLLSPTSNGVLLAGEMAEIEWAATGQNNEPVSEVRLDYAINADPWTPIATVTSGNATSFMVPTQSRGQELRIRAIAVGSNGMTSQVVSEPLNVIEGEVATYGNATNIEISGLGFRTSSWNAVNGNPSPVSSALSSLDRLGVSDGVSFFSSNPGSGWESTHVFEATIAEDIADIAQIDVQFEGYATSCAQIELYIWDNLANNWGDGAGATGQNAYADNWAGNLDGFLDARITDEFDRYVSPTGEIRFMLYVERSGSRTVLDFAELNVTTFAFPLGDTNCDGLVNAVDIEPFVLAVVDPAGYAATYPGCDVNNADANDDGLVDARDIEAFVDLVVNGG